MDEDIREFEQMLQDWRDFKQAFLDGFFGRPLVQENSDAD